MEEGELRTEVTNCAECKTELQFPVKITKDFIYEDGLCPTCKVFDRNKKLSKEYVATLKANREMEKESNELFKISI